jgi:hypothetical protein
MTTRIWIVLVCLISFGALAQRPSDLVSTNLAQSTDTLLLSTDYGSGKTNSVKIQVTNLNAQVWTAIGLKLSSTSNLWYVVSGTNEAMDGNIFVNRVIPTNGVLFPSGALLGPVTLAVLNSGGRAKVINNSSTAFSTLMLQGGTGAQDFLELSHNGTVDALVYTNGDIQSFFGMSSPSLDITNFVKLRNATASKLVITDSINLLTNSTLATTDLFTVLTKADVLDAGFFAADAGGSDTYSATLSPAITAYVTGVHYRFKANTANTGAATINLNTLGAKTIKKPVGGITTDLSDNDIRAGQWVEVVYDGTNMQMISQLGNAGSGTGDALVANPLSQFAATTSAQFAGVISDETGVGKVLLADGGTAGSLIVTSNLTAGSITVLGTGTNTMSDLNVTNSVNVGGLTVVSNIVVGGTVTAANFIAGATNFVSALNLKAPLASPTFTGDPQAPNVVLSDSDTTIANTAFVKSNITAISTFVLKAGDTMSGTLTVTGLTNSALTASQAVVTAADKSLASVAYTGSGNVMRTRTGVWRNITIPADGWMINRTNSATQATNSYAGTGYFDVPLYSFADAQTNRITRIFNTPEAYDGGTVKLKFTWSATGSGDVKWFAHGKILPDNGDPNTAWGTSVSIVDTAQTASRPLQSGATGAMTFGGTPAAGSVAVIEVYRDAGDASDTLNSSAELWLINMGYQESATEPTAW